jgi:hypothetical protein
VLKDLKPKIPRSFETGKTILANPLILFDILKIDGVLLIHRIFENPDLLSQPSNSCRSGKTGT